jgi:hypothetical protein
MTLFTKEQPADEKPPAEKIVPREPTQEMLVAGRTAPMQLTIHDPPQMVEIWRRMFDAAPD